MMLVMTMIVNNIINKVEDRYIVNGELNIYHTVYDLEITSMLFNISSTNSETVEYNVIDSNISTDYGVINVKNISLLDGVYGIKVYINNAIFGEMCVKVIN